MALRLCSIRTLLSVDSIFESREGAPTSSTIHPFDDPTRLSQVSRGVQPPYQAGIKRLLSQDAGKISSIYSQDLCLIPEVCSASSDPDLGTFTSSSTKWHDGFSIFLSPSHGPLSAPLPRVAKESWGNDVWVLQLEMSPSNLSGFVCAHKSRDSRHTCRAQHWAGQGKVVATLCSTADGSLATDSPS